MITRRDLLRMAAAAPVSAAVRLNLVQAPPGLNAAALTRAPWRVHGPDGSLLSRVEVTRTWRGAQCSARLRNVGPSPVRVGNIVLFDLEHGLAPSTAFYGEGFQMLTQNGGSIAAPQDLGNYTDPKHYKLPQPDGARVVYGLATFAGGAPANRILAFTSCRRFTGSIRVRQASLQVVQEGEGLSLDPGESWELEEVTYDEGADRTRLLDRLASRINTNHPPLGFSAPPAGWCSWYCFGPRVTAQQVLDNLAVIATRIPELRYIQIDDGYQPAMGDWLETGAAFGGNVQAVLREIRERGFEPAIWVAPFIAEAGSNLFKAHPDWFVMDGSGRPLRSDTVTFGGWRRGPWYALDGTHPEAQAHLRHVFTTMRKEWGCTYFKLDANFWGAIHGGRFFDPRATRIDAYRRGMRAVLEGTEGTFVLGCNHPIWPSLGLIHGSRSSHDIKRDWKRISDTARQNLMRNWQNGRLWWNDPDAIVLTGDLPDNEFRFHATAIYATGGMTLSGDDLTTISPARMDMLRKLVPPTGVAARFPSDALDVGIVDLPGKRAYCVLNWGDSPRKVSLPLDAVRRATELWTGETLGPGPGRVPVTLGARDGRVFITT